MRNLKNKLKSITAETLLETLVSILIATLSITLLSTAIMASARMNSNTAKADEEYNNSLQAAECYEGTPVSGTVTLEIPGLSDVEIDVNIYGDGNFASYKK